MEKTNNSVSWFTKIGFQYSFDLETLSGGRVYENIINNIADRHVSGEIKDLDNIVNDLAFSLNYEHLFHIISINLELGKVTTKLYKDIYDNIFNNEDKSKLFVKNIIENTINDTEKFVIEQSDNHIDDGIINGLINGLIKLNDNNEYDKINQFIKNVSYLKEYEIREKLKKHIIENKDVEGTINLINNTSINVLPEVNDDMFKFQNFKDFV